MTKAERLDFGVVPDDPCIIDCVDLVDGQSTNEVEKKAKKLVNGLLWVMPDGRIYVPNRCKKDLLTKSN